MDSIHMIKFREFITLQRGFDLPKKMRRNGYFPVVASTSVQGFHDEYKVKTPGVVTGRSGSLGQVLFIEQPFWPLNTTLWVKDFKGNNPRYVYYYLQTLCLERYNSGAGVPTLNRNHLNEIEVGIHVIESQKKISAILSAYDDLIENNLRRIKILEEMAQNLYREWFVKFRFPGHEQVRMVDSPLGKIPKGWEVSRLDQLIAFQNEGTKAGEHLYNRIYLPIDCVPRKSLAVGEVRSWEEAKSSLHLFEEGDVIFGAMRPYFHKVVVAPFKGVTRKTCFVLRSQKPTYHAFSILKLFQESTVSFANSHSKGATIPYAVWPQAMDGMLVVLPPEELAESFETIVGPMISTIGNTYFRDKNLRQTRDLLLPKLISGELDVSELDIDIGKAA